MEIEFNTGRIPRTGAGQPVPRQDSVPAPADAASFPASDTLKSQLNNASTVRPEQVARAAALVAQPGYPPNDVLDRMAVLIAAKLHAGSPGQSGQSS